MSLRSEHEGEGAKQESASSKTAEYEKQHQQPNEVDLQHKQEVWPRNEKPSYT